MSNNNLNNLLSNATNLSSILNALVSISSIEDINTLIPPNFDSQYPYSATITTTVNNRESQADFLSFRDSLLNSTFNFSSFRDSVLNNSLNFNPRRGLSALSNPENILVAKRFEDYQYNKAKEYFVDNIKKDKTQDYVSRSLLNIILDLWTDNDENDEYPVLEEIIDKVYEYRCQCVYLINELNIKNMLKDYISEKGDLPRCREYSYLIEYHIINKKIPSDQELEDFMIRAMEFMVNPEEFHQKDKIHVPALGVDKLPVCNYCKDTCKSTTCSLCQEDFTEEQKIITLLPCKHEFHYNDKECLGNASIKNWLDNNNYCPLCKTKVEIKE